VFCGFRNAIFLALRHFDHLLVHPTGWKQKIITTKGFTCSDVVRKFGVRIRVIGNESLLSSDIRDIIDKANEATKDNYQ
jgi:undecaprenyl pyrophosphate synthase